ncbi:hypothetical protein ACFX1S_040380 [Malus domestica]
MVKGAPVHQHDFILAFLSNSFSQFVMNYNMNKMDNILSELLNMLVTVEKTMKKENVVGTAAVAYNKSSTSKAKPKGKSKGNEKKSSAPNAQGGVKKKKAKEHKGICHHCGKDGLWKMNCRLYLASLKDKPQSMVFALIFNSNY